MRTPQHDLQRLFRGRGLRVTPQRVAIAEVVMERGRHVAAADVYRRAKARLPYLSRATVYNTLKALVRTGVLVELVLEEGSVLYDNNTSAHHHFVCEDTGEVLDVPRGLVRVPRHAGLGGRFRVRDYTIVFRGTVKQG